MKARERLVAFVDKQASRLLRNTEETLRCATVDSVHDYRVASRRLREPLALMQPWLKERDVRGLQRDLRRLRQTCRTVRDLDVLLAALAADGDATGLSPEDLAHLEGIATGLRAAVLCKALGKLKRIDIRKLHKRVLGQRERFLSRASDADVVKRGGSQWLERALKLRATNPTGAGAQLHTTRVRLKGLRYCTELLDAIGDRERSSLVADCAAMQDQLGAWNDDLFAARQVGAFALAAEQLAEQENWSANVLGYVIRRVRAAEVHRAALAAWPALASGIEAYGDTLCGPRPKRPATSETAHG